MRKIIVTSYVSLDGVMQSPGGGEDDFKYSGWSAPYYDQFVDDLTEKNKKSAADYLIGRKTFEMSASFFPSHPEIWPGIIEGTKYVMTNSLKKSDPLITGWKNTEIVESVEDIQKLKSSKGLDIQVFGSGELIQLLLKNDLVDQLWLLIHPISFGQGNRLFAEGTIPVAFTLTECQSSPSGVIIAHYQRAGEIKTGVMGG